MRNGVSVYCMGQGNNESYFEDCAIVILWYGTFKGDRRREKTVQSYPYETFIVLLFFWTFVFLASTFLITFFIFLRKRSPGSAWIPMPKFGRSQTVSRASQPRKASSAGGFSDKLGDQIVKYMVEVSASSNRSVVNDRMAKIRAECERLNSLDLPKENKQIISSVLVWAKKFNIERHLNELRLFRESSQIIYDSTRRDFKLKIGAD